MLTMDKQTLVQVLEQTRSDLSEAYRLSSSNRTDDHIMKALGRVDTLIKIAKSS